MKKLFLLAFSLILMFMIGSNAEALPFTFSGSDEGGTGSAMMDIKIVGNLLTLTLDNTSPLTLDDGTGVNTPGILGFGFDLKNDPLPGLSSWELTAFDKDGNVQIIGEDGTDLSWIMDTFQAGVNLDYLPQSDEGGVQGALYNPDATAGLAALPNYFTTATLIMEFADDPVLDITSTYVRMQNVGADGEGSLKLHGDAGPGHHTLPIPEPSTILLLGIGLIGLLGFGKKFRKS